MGERRFQLMFLLFQTIGISYINNISSIASSFGTIGSIISFFLIFVLLGIPLIYMELIIGQFTGRDCLGVWKIRPFLSYTGYGIILWQVIILTYNHAIVSFIVHYFLISFENPIPYYQCGHWSTMDCNILTNNYTVNEDCLRHERPANYCSDVPSTFPECQYWRNHVLNKENDFYLAWRVCLASGLACILLYLSCFKRKKSVEWIVSYLPLYPILGFISLMIGSMLQKGFVSKFEDALDLEFLEFGKKFRLGSIIQHVVYNLGLGSGLTINFASSTSFRSNCFLNGVMSVVISAFFTVIVICTTAMMSCPYAYQYDIPTGSVIKSPMSLMFEKIPRLLSEYDHSFFWLILVFSCNVALGLCTDVLLFYNLLETVYKRNPRIANYPGLSSLVAILVLFLLTIPLLSNFGILFALVYRRFVTLASTFIVMIECLVFITTYGIHKFSEDVHFMLGIQPSFYMKTAWSLAGVLLAYAFFSEIIYNYKLNQNGVFWINLFGWSLLSFICGFIVISCIGKLLVALCRKRFLRILRLHSSWGPKSDILQRSRAMFSAQAMTKEYMYRQYHLQAGIAARQRNSNKEIITLSEQELYLL